MAKQIDPRVQQNEDTFQEALYNYRLYNKKSDWDIMFLCVQKACENIAKSKAYGIHIQDLEGKALDAACKIMNKIKDGVNPDKLSSYCYLWVIGEIWSAKHRRWEEAESFDGLFDNYAYTENEDKILTICSSNY